MSKNDIILTLFTIVYGLMLTDLFISVHRLILARNRIKWHWLPLLSAWFIFMLIIKNWWILAFNPSFTNTMTPWLFVVYGHLLFLLFLSVSSVLLDVVPEKGIDLKNFYFDNQRYFWGVLSGVIFILLMIYLSKVIFLDARLNPLQIISSSLFFSLALLLAVTKKYLVHASIQCFIVLALLFELSIQ